MDALDQAESLSRNAFLKVPDAGRAEEPSVSIKQGAGESYMEFIDRLKNAVDKQAENVDAYDLILKQSAVENASEDWQKILHPMRNPTLIKMTDACNRAGTHT